MKYLPLVLCLVLLGGCEDSDKVAQKAYIAIQSLCQKNYAVPAQEAACEHGAYIGVIEVAKMQGITLHD